MFFEKQVGRAWFKDEKLFERSEFFSSVAAGCVVFKNICYSKEFFLLLLFFLAEKKKSKNKNRE
jgi:hypothetical protein